MARLREYRTRCRIIISARYGNGHCLRKPGYGAFCSHARYPTIRDIGCECHAGRADRTAARQALATAVIDKFDMFDQAAKSP